MAELYRFPTIVLIICLFCICTEAQSTAALVISVSDPNGNIVAGAATELTGENTKKIAAVASDLGVISYRGLSPGKYELTITVDGFKPYKNAAIELRVNGSKKIDVVLELDEIRSNVDVDESEAVDPTTSGTVRDLKKEEIETLPTDPDELRRVLQSMAGPTLTGEEMPISVNGIPGATLPNKENIKLVRINRNVFSAQYEYSSGGGIEIYTDGDIKKISGYFGGSFNDARLNATNPYIGRRVPASSQGFWYGFSTPLGKKASVSVHSSFGWNRNSSVVNAIVLDQNLNPLDFRESYETSSFYGWNGVWVNWDPNKKLKVVASFDFNFSNNDNADIGGFSLASRANKNRYLNLSTIFKATYILNPNFINETRFLMRSETSESRGASSETALNVSEAFNAGGSQTNRETTNSRFEIYNDTTRKFGRLNMGFGAMVRGYRINEDTRSNFGGTYTFSGRTAPVLDANYQPVLDGSGNVVTTAITSLESYRRTLLLQRLGFTPAQIRVRGGGADQFTIAGGIPELRVSQIDYSVYQQNNFGISETTGISFGMRYENQTNIEDFVNFAPRIGFTWAPKAREKQKPETTLPRVTLGYGLFYQRFGVNYAMTELQSVSPDRQFFFITDPAILDRFPVAPSVADLTQGSTLRSLRLIDDDLHTPRSKIFSINLTKALWSGMSVNAGYTRAHAVGSILTRNINAPFAAPAGSTAPPVYPFGNSRNVYETRSDGRSRSDRIFVSMGLPQWKVFGKPMYASLWYSFSKVRNDVVAGSSSPLDPYDFSQEWGPSTADGVHQLNSFFNINLPHDFSIRGDINIRNGSRFNIITGRDTNRDGIYAERPAFAPDPNKPGVVRTIYGLLDPNPAAGAVLIPRNIGRGPLAMEVNMYLGKTFGFNRDKANKNAPRQRLSFNINAINVFNRNNKGNPVANMSSPNFLQTISTSGFDGELRPTNPRRLQFSTSFSF